MNAVDVVVLGLRPGEDVVEAPAPGPAQEHDDEHGESGGRTIPNPSMGTKLRLDPPAGNHARRSM